MPPRPPDPAGAAAHVRRFFRGFRWALSPEEARRARAWLGPAELRCFMALQARERRHAMDVAEWLLERGSPSRDLLAAALLHNAGKGSIHLHERVAYTLLGCLAPGLLDRLASPGGRGFRGAMAAQRDHPERGAELLAAIGVRPRVLDLVRGHHDPAAPADPELAALIEADLRR